MREWGIGDKAERRLEKGHKGGSRVTAPQQQALGSRGLPLHTPQFWGCLIQDRLMGHFPPASKYRCARQGHPGSQFGLLRDKSISAVRTAGDRGGGVALPRVVPSLSGPGHSALGWCSLLSCSEAQNALLSLLTKGRSPCLIEDS